MGMPVPKMQKFPTLEEYIKSGRGRTSTKAATDDRVTERDTGERMTQAGYIYDPVFTPINNLINDN